MISRRLFSFILVVAVVALIAVRSPAEESENRTYPPYTGTDAFRALLKFEGIQPVKYRPKQPYDPEEFKSLILILIRPTHDSDWQMLSREVLRAGGAVLIAAGNNFRMDHPLPSPRDLSPFFPTLPSNTITLAEGVQPSDQKNELEDGGEYLLVESEDLVSQTLFDDMRRFRVRMPSTALTLNPNHHSPYTAHIVTRFPAGSRYGFGENPLKLQENQVFAIAGMGNSTHPFRSLILGNSSPLQNKMMADATAQNLMFGLNVIRWLRGPEQRNRCLFVEYAGGMTGSPSQVIKDDFNKYGLVELSEPTLPTPPIPNPLDPKFQTAMTDTLNRGIAAVEDRNFLNKSFGSKTADDLKAYEATEQQLRDEANHQNRRYSRTLWSLAIAALIGGAGWLFLRSWVARHSPDIPRPPRDEIINEFGPSVGSVAHRKAELSREGQLAWPIREYLRGMFAERGLMHPPLDGPLPPVEVTGARSKALKQQLQTVWAAVFDPASPPITPDNWKELEPMIDEIRQAAHEGRFTFPTEGRA